MDYLITVEARVQVKFTMHDAANASDAERRARRLIQDTGITPVIGTLSALRTVNDDWRIREITEQYGNRTD